MLNIFRTFSWNQVDWPIKNFFFELLHPQIAFFLLKLTVKEKSTSENNDAFEVFLFVSGGLDDFISQINLEDATRKKLGQSE